MKFESFFYRCSPGDVDAISANLHGQIVETIELMPKRGTVSDIEFDLFWLLTSMGWSYDSVPVGISMTPPNCFDLDCTLDSIMPDNERRHCLTTATLDPRWHADFAKQFDAGLVHLEAQFGPAEALLKDFCGFRMAYAEERLALGIEIVIADPLKYFGKNEGTADDTAGFQLAKDSLATIDLDCPVWLIGIEE